jgi:hypothetical protein
VAGVNIKNIEILLGTFGQALVAEAFPDRHDAARIIEGVLVIAAVRASAEQRSGRLAP